MEIKVNVPPDAKNFVVKDRFFEADIPKGKFCYSLPVGDWKIKEVKTEIEYECFDRIVILKKQ